MKSSEIKKAVMYGAGNIGRGFLGQLFHMSGYETTFIDVNPRVVQALNAQGRYPIFITEGDSYREYTVDRVRGVMGDDAEAVSRAIAEADILATAVGVSVLSAVAAPLARGIRLRRERGVSAPLPIIVCENMIGADRALADWIRAELDRDSLAYFDDKIRTVEPSIGRMVPKTPEHLLSRNPLAVCVEPYCELPVDRDAFRGEIPPIAHMIPYSPFDFYIRRKLYLHNMSHALCAYLGAERGYTYIWQAVADGEIRAIARNALREASAALSAEYGVLAEELDGFCEDLLSRFDNRLLGDTVSRVGFDTARKLSSTDRFMGAIGLCEKHGLPYDSILRGFCAGFRFCPEGDIRSAGVFFAAKQNPARTLCEVSGIEEGTVLHQKAMALLHS